MKGQHDPTVDSRLRGVTENQIPFRSLPHVAALGGCGGSRPAAGQYRSHLGPILAMAERRLADRTACLDLIADAIVRQQRASTETA